MQTQTRHQYVDRHSGDIRTERLFKDPFVNFLYSRVRENAEHCFNLLIAGHTTTLLGYLNFDLSFHQNRAKAREFIEDLGIDMAECLIPEDRFCTARQVFERQIRYWECRPMPGEIPKNQPDWSETKASNTPSDNHGIVISPSDAKVLVGSLCPNTPLFIKEKFFSFKDLFGKDEWMTTFQGGDFALFRLTPDAYHYNHVPVSGRVKEIYEINGAYHACNPGAVVREVTPYSKNSRVVTVMDTDVPGGSNVGKVAMIEVAAMMIGIIEQCYSKRFYDDPCDIHPGMFLEKGQPKSLFRPGSSTVILVFETGRIQFSRDIVDNMHRMDGESRFTTWFGKPLLETAVRVRETVAYPNN